MLEVMTSTRHVQGSRGRGVYPGNGTSFATALQLENEHDDDMEVRFAVRVLDTHRYRGPAVGNHL